MTRNVYKLTDLIEKPRDITYGVVQPGKAVLQGIPIIKVNNITSSDFSVKNMEKVSEEIEGKYTRSRLVGNEILISLVGSLGFLCKVDKRMIGWNVARAVGVLPIKKEYSREWIYQYLRSPIAQNALKTLATTSVQATINLKELRELEIPYPSKIEIEAIIEILSALDDKIELNLQMNKTLEEMTNALFKHWFVDFGPFKDAKFVESELGMIPQGWKTTKLRDLIDIINGYAFKGSDFIPSGIAVLKIKNVKAGRILLNDLAYVAIEACAKAERAKVLFNDILITMTGNRFDGTPETWVGKVAMFSRSGLYYLNQRVSKIKIKNEKILSKYFLTQILSSEEFQNYFITNATSSGGQANISPDLIYNTTIILPSQSVISKYDSTVCDLFAKIYSNELVIDFLKQTRDYLLPKLISGEIRVKEAQKKIKELV